VIRPTKLSAYHGFDCNNSRCIGKAIMKYWEIIADKLGKAGWTWGYCSAVTCYGQRHVVESDELVNAFLAGGRAVVGFLPPKV